MAKTDTGKNQIITIGREGGGTSHPQTDTQLGDGMEDVKLSRLEMPDNKTEIMVAVRRNVQGKRREQLG